MKPLDILRGLRDGNFHEGGIRCLRLLRLHEAYFHGLQTEVQRLCENEDPSDVRSSAHVTNWTRPRGEVVQYSLYNLSGRTDDFSTDHEVAPLGKRFHFAADYPCLAGLIDTFPDLVNFRLNVLGPGARLAAHEEHSIIGMNNTIGACIRTHLPVETNDQAELTLDNHVFHLEAGNIYLVNHGCIHAARNGGARRRLHLVWDQLLTQRAYDISFGDANIAWATRFPKDEQSPAVLRIERMGASLKLPTPVDRDAAEKLELFATE